MACKDCVNLVVSAGKFALRCGKASYMFWELSNGKFSKSKGDLVRKLYGLSESEEFSHAKAEEVHAPESKIKYLEIEYVEGHSLQVDSADAHSAGSVQNEEMYVADNIVSDNVESLEQTKAGDVSMEQMENGNSHSEEEEAFVKIEMLDDPTDIDHKESVKKCSKKKKTSSAGFTCALCDMKFIGHKWYDKHMKSRHSSKCAELACSKCPKRFNKRYNLKEHENIHLPDDMRFIKCPECDRKYRTAASLRSHIRFVHTREGVCVCEECGKVFGDMCTLRYHKIVHVQQRLSQCTICPKTFKDITHLKKHMEIHSEEMHECPECGRQFNTKRRLFSLVIFLFFLFTFTLFCRLTFLASPHIWPCILLIRSTNVIYANLHSNVDMG